MYDMESNGNEFNPK